MVLRFLSGCSRVSFGLVLVLVCSFSVGLVSFGVVLGFIQCWFGGSFRVVLDVLGNISIANEPLSCNCFNPPQYQPGFVDLDLASKLRVLLQE